jgi:hypothetical protein
MTDPDRSELDLLEPLGAVPPPAPELLTRVAGNLRARYLEETARGAGAATPARRRTRKALLVAAAATVVTGLVALGLVGAAHSNHGNAPAATISSPATQSLRNAILTAFSNSASSISYTHSVWTSAGQGTTVIDIWTAPFEGSTGQSQVRREVVTLGGEFVRDTEMIYTVPSPAAGVPANCHGQVDSPKPPPIRAQSAAIQTTDGRLIDVDYGTRSWSDQHETCIAVTKAADAEEIRSDIASGDWAVDGRDTINGHTALRLRIGGPGQPASADLLWVDAQTYLPLQASADKGGAPGANSLVTTYQFLSATPANQQNLTTPIPAGFTRTAAPDR